jgi:hypothetical protein
MLKQYKVLTSCLSELKASNLPVIDKLKLEVQIIRLKRVLLDHEVAHGVLGVASSEQEFNDLYGHVRSACSSSSSGRGTDELSSHLHDIKTGLENGATAYFRDGYPQRKGFAGRVLGAVVKSMS